MTPFARLVLTGLLAAATLHAAAAPAPLPDDKRQALSEFVVAYRLAEAWPRMAPKIARDSMPRLEAAVHAAIDRQAAAEPARDAAAHARVPALRSEGRRLLEAALQRFDAGKLADYTAYEVYGQVFDTDEIRQISAFFGSPAGRKLTGQAPAILAESRRPGAGDVLPRHFDPDDLTAITAFWESPVGRKMNRTAEQVREAMHAHFVERSEPVLQAVARTLATRALAPAAAGDGVDAASAQ